MLRVASINFYNIQQLDNNLFEATWKTKSFTSLVWNIICTKLLSFHNSSPISNLYIQQVICLVLKNDGDLKIKTVAFGQNAPNLKIARVMSSPRDLQSKNTCNCSNIILMKASQHHNSTNSCSIKPIIIFMRVCSITRPW